MIVGLICVIGAVLVFLLYKFVFKSEYAKGIAICFLFIFLAIPLCFSLLDLRLISYNNQSTLKKGVSIETLEDILLSNTVCFTEKDDIVEVTYQDLGIKVSNISSDILNDYLIDLDNLSVNWNTSNLGYYIDELNSGRIENKYAVLSKSNNCFEVSKDIQGDYLDKDKLLNDIVSDLGKRDCLYDLSDYYIELDKSRSYYNSYTSQVKILEDFRIEYTNGASISYIDFFDYFLIKNKEIVLDRNNQNLIDSVEAFVKNELSSYNTVGIERDFKTTNGDTITLSSGTYGDKVDFESEVSFILDSLNSLTSTADRVPEYALDLPDELGNTYIEVSLNDQHLWYYVDGELLMETDVVTGGKGRHDTPVGIYYISEKIDGKYLTGDDYKTWVNKWMRLTNTGIGLHDAYWRSSFGKNIYTYNGSHGCVNLPKKFAYDLFDAVERKTAVIIY